MTAVLAAGNKASSLVFQLSPESVGSYVDCAVHGNVPSYAVVLPGKQLGKQRTLFNVMIVCFACSSARFDFSTVSQ